MLGARGGERRVSKASWREDVAQRHCPAARTWRPLPEVSFGIVWVSSRKRMVGVLKAILSVIVTLYMLGLNR